MNKQEQIEEMRREIGNGFRKAYCRAPYTNTPYPYFETQKIAIAEALYNAGYRKVPYGAVVLTPQERDDEIKACNENQAEVEAEIERLKAEIERLEEQVEMQRNEKWDAQDDLECYHDEIQNIVKQAQIDVLNKLKKKTHNYYSSIDSYCISQHIVLVRDIDELLKEYEE